MSTTVHLSPGDPTYSKHLYFIYGYYKSHYLESTNGLQKSCTSHCPK